MADIVGSLFGLSVPELEAQRRQRMMEDNQQSALYQSKGSIAPGRTYNQALLGRSLGQAIGGALFGVQDPMIERATKLEGILKQTQDELGADSQDPVKLYGTLSQKLGEAGFGRESAQALQLGKDAELGYMKAKTDLLKAQREGDTRPEYLKLLSAYNTAVESGDTTTAESIKGRLDVLAKEGQTAPSTDKLIAENVVVINDPKSTPEQVAKAKAMNADIFAQKNLPSGFERDPITGEVRPQVGGPADIKLKEENTKKIGALSSKITSLSSVQTAIADAKRLISDKTTGKVGYVLKHIPGEPANALASNLTTITANLAFDKLQDMRNNSPTGGALGNVSNLELESLKSAIANLNQSLDKTSLAKNLATVEAIYSRILAAANSDLNKYQATTPASSQSGGFAVGKTYQDKNGNKAVYQQDGTWKDVK